MLTGWSLSTKNLESKSRVSGCFSTGVPRDRRSLGPNFTALLFQRSEKKERDVKKRNLPLLLQKPLEQHEGPWTVSFFPLFSFFIWMIYTCKRLPAGGISLHLRQENIPEISHQMSESVSAAFRSLGNRSSLGLTLHLHNHPHVHPCAMPTDSHWSRSQGYWGERLPQRLWETKKNPRSEGKERSRSWIIEWITFVWALGETTKETEIHPLFFNPLSGMWEATGESNLRIPQKATSGSIATVLAAHINSRLYVVLSVQ